MLCVQLAVVLSFILLAACQDRMPATPPPPNGVRMIYLSPTGSDTNSSGTKADPYLTLFRALQDTQTPVNADTTITLAPGTYSGAKNAVEFNIPKGIGVTLVGDDQATTILGNTTIISGGGSFHAESLTFSNPNGVGTHIKDGQGHTFNKVTWYKNKRAEGASFGAGVVVEPAALGATFTSCTVDSNVANSCAGIFIQANIGKWVITDTNFLSNTAVHADIGTGTGAAICVFNNVNLQLSNCQFLNNYAGSSGGAIWTLGTITDTTGFYKNNSASTAGAVVITSQSASAESTFAGTRFENNVGFSTEGSYKGGAVHITSGVLHAVHCHFNANAQAHGNGGGLAASGTSLVYVIGGAFSNNTAAGGAALSAHDRANLIISGVQISNGIAHAIGATGADSLGGGVYVTDQAQTNISSSYFESNTVVSFGGLGTGGGAIALSTSSRCVLDTVHFNNNVALSSGGAIFISGPRNRFVAPSHLITGCTFTQNRATSQSIGFGGAILVSTDGLGQQRIQNSVFTGNSGVMGGGALSTSLQGALDVTDCNFTDNTATQGGGGAIWLQNVAVSSIYTSAFVSNTGILGGAVLVTGKTTQGGSTFYGSSFTNNIAKARGGAVQVRAFSDVTLTGCIFSGNTDSSGGNQINLDADASVDLSGSAFCDATGAAVVCEAGGIIHGDVFFEDQALEVKTCTQVGADTPAILPLPTIAVPNAETAACVCHGEKAAVFASTQPAVKGIASLTVETEPLFGGQAGTKLALSNPLEAQVTSVSKASDILGQKAYHSSTSHLEETSPNLAGRYFALSLASMHPATQGASCYAIKLSATAATTTHGSTPSPPADDGLAPWAIALIVIAIFVVGGGIGAGFAWYSRGRRVGRDVELNSTHDNPYNQLE